MPDLSDWNVEISGPVSLLAYAAPDIRCIDCEFTEKIPNSMNGGDEVQNLLDAGRGEVLDNQIGSRYILVAGIRIPESYTAHFGVFSSGDSVRRILDDHAICGPHAQLFGGCEKDLRIRFAPCHLCATDNDIKMRL